MEIADKETESKKENVRTKVVKTIKLMSFLELITLILMIAKLGGYTAMSWFWVFLPVIVHAVVGIALIFVILFVILLAIIIAAIAS